MSDNSKIREIYELLNTLSEEAQKAALSKCDEMAFNADQGIVPLNESLINLNASRLIIKDAIEKNKLSNLPITVQRTLYELINKISDLLTSLANGKDQVINLVDEIEKLNVAVWQFGFHNLSAEALGYLEKTNQIKKLEKELISLKKNLEEGLNLKKDLKNLLENISKENDAIQKKTLSIEENLKNTNKNAEGIAESASIYTEKLNSLKDQEKQVEKQLALIVELKEKGEDLTNDIEKISKRSDSIIKTINDQEKELNTLIENTKTTYKQVENLLPGAASAGLANAFRDRRVEIAKSKMFWIAGFVASVIGLVVTVVWLGPDPNTVDKEEWWKFLIHRAPFVFPLIWLGWFFGRNYGHIVRLEEDYAFKESISKSFEGYKKQMLEVDPTGALKNLCDKTITILSEAPLRVFDRKTNDETPANSFFERFFSKRQPLQVEKNPENKST